MFISVQGVLLYIIIFMLNKISNVGLIPGAACSNVGLGKFPASLSCIMNLENVV